MDFQNWSLWGSAKIGAPSAAGLEEVQVSGEIDQLWSISPTHQTDRPPWAGSGPWIDSLKLSAYKPIGGLIASIRGMGRGRR